MKSIKKLMEKKERLDLIVRDLKNSISGALGGADFKVGTHLHMVVFSSQDKEVIALIKNKLKFFEDKLYPINERLKILDELAVDVLNEKAPVSIKQAPQCPLSAPQINR